MNMDHRILRLVVLSFVAAMLCVPALQAGPITVLRWTIDPGTMLDDGLAVTGYFDLDYTTQSVVNWHISVPPYSSGGNPAYASYWEWYASMQPNGVIPGYDFMPSTSTLNADSGWGSFLDLWSPSAAEGGQIPQVGLKFPGLPETGGTVPLRYSAAYYPGYGFYNIPVREPVAGGNWGWATMGVGIDSGSVTSGPAGAPEPGSAMLLVTPLLVIAGLHRWKRA